MGTEKREGKKMEKYKDPPPKKKGLDGHELCSITPKIHSCLLGGNNF